MNTKRQILMASLLATVLIGSGVSASTVNFVSESQTTSTKSITKEADELELWTPWMSRQETALEKIISEYNVWNDGKGLMDVKPKKIEGAYKTLTETLQQNIKINATEAMPDLYINYLDSTSSLLQFGSKNYAYDISKGEQEAFGSTKITDALVPEMSRQNENLAGSTKGSVYAIPLSVSSQIMGLNAPLLISMLNSFINQGGTIVVSENPAGNELFRQILDSADGEKDGVISKAVSNDVAVTIDEVVYQEFAPASEKEIELDSDKAASSIAKAYENISQSDKDNITTKWKDKSDNTNALSGRILNISDETFNSILGISRMSSLLLQAVTPTNGTASGQTAQAIYGHDAPVNDVYVYGQQITDSYNNPEAGLLSLTGGDATHNGNDVTFNMINEGTSGYNAAEMIIEYFLNGFEKGSIWVPNNGVTYGSDLLVNHNMAMSIGSTAGASHLFMDNSGYPDYTPTPERLNSGEVVFTQAPGKFDPYMSKDINVQIQQGPSIGAVNKTGKDDFYNETRSKSIAAFLDYLVSNDSKTLMNTGEGKDFSNHSVIDGKDVYETKLPEVDNKKVYATYASGTEAIKDGKFSTEPNELVTLEKSSTTNNLDGDEKYYFDYTSTVVTRENITGQEPKSTHKVTKAYDVKLKPAEYMSEYSNYIVGSKSVITGKSGVDASFFEKIISSPTLFSTGKWDEKGEKFESYDKYNSLGGNGGYANPYVLGPKITYDNMLNATTLGGPTPTIQLENEPYGLYTSGFRTAINTFIQQEKVAVATGKQANSVWYVLAEIHNEAIRNGWDKGELIPLPGQGGAMKTLIIIAISIASLVLLIAIILAIWKVVSHKKKTSLKI